MSNPVKGLLVTRGAKEREIAALKADFARDLERARAEEASVKDRVIAGKDEQMRGAANAFYGQGLVFDSIPQPTRTDLIFDNLAKEGWTALGHVQPTYEAMQAMNERLKAELDETRTSLSDLQRNHAAALAQNQALADATKRHQEELAALGAKRIQLEADFKSRLDKATLELVDAQNRLIAAERERANDRTAIHAMKTKLSLILGVVALAALAGAIWSPLFKDKFAVLSAICGGLAVAIWYITGVQVAIAGAVGLALLVGWVIINQRKVAAKHAQEEKLADSLVLANQRIKDTQPEVWKTTIAPVVADQLGRYNTGAGGKPVVERDPEMEALVDEKLKAYEALGPLIPTGQN